MPKTPSGLRYPTDNDSFDLALDISNLAADVEAHFFPRYGTAAERDAAIPNPGNGSSVAWVSGVGLTAYSSGAWVVVLGNTGLQNLTPNAPFVIGTGSKLVGINGGTYYSLDIRRTGSSWTGPINILTFPPGSRPVGIPHYDKILRQGTGADLIGGLTIATNGVATISIGGAANDHLYASGWFPSA